MPIPKRIADSLTGEQEEQVRRTLEGIASQEASDTARRVGIHALMGALEFSAEDAETVAEDCEMDVFPEHRADNGKLAEGQDIPYLRYRWYRKP